MNIRKTLSIITTALLVAFYVAGAIVAGVVYNPTPVPPISAVIAVSTEPDYLVTIAWKRVPNAYAYELEYKYDYEPTKTGYITTAKTSFRIERIKGNLNFRMRTVYNNGKRFSKYSDWKTYYVEPLYLPAAKPCNLMHDGTSVRFIRHEWSDNAYKSFMFKGKIQYIDYYDFFVVGPTNEKEYEIHNLRTIPNAEVVTTPFIQLATNNSGEWTVYFRPSFCMAVVSGKKIYNDELLKIFDETDAWTSSHITVE